MITYDTEGRAFWNGKRIPRTTEICSLLAPREWKADEYYLRKGTLIHRIVEWDESGELDESSVDPSLTGYLTAYRNFKTVTKWKPFLTERSFFHKKYGYCGRADQIGNFGNSKWLWVLDIKSGQPHRADKLQSPAYLFGLKQDGYPVSKCADLYLGENANARFEEVKNPTEKFLKFLTGIKKWREENES